MPRYAKLKMAIALVFLFSLSSPAGAHDGWIEITPSVVEKGQIATITLMHGNHSNDHRSYRIAGKWDQKYTTLTLWAPNGKQIDLTRQLVDLGEDDEKTGPKGPKGFHVAPLTATEQGLYLAVARQVRTLQQGDGPKFSSVRIAKSAFAAFETPSFSETKKLQTQDRVLTGDDGLEIVALTNPVAVVSGASIEFEVRHRGKPALNKTVTLVRRIGGAASAQDRMTDEKGRVAFTVGPADFYLARVKFEEESPRADGQSDKNSYESTYVFQVFNRR